jgi:hypothetical protein
LAAADGEEELRSSKRHQDILPNMKRGTLGRMAICLSCLERELEQRPEGLIVIRDKESERRVFDERWSKVPIWERGKNEKSELPCEDLWARDERRERERENR